jgi:hypothetical protein
MLDFGALDGQDNAVFDVLSADFDLRTLGDAGDALLQFIALRRVDQDRQGHNPSTVLFYHAAP